MENTLAQIIILILIIVFILLLWYFFRKTQDETKATTTAGKAKPDDLKIIEGIGPKIFSVFKKAGINTFDDLAKAKPDYLRKLLDDAGVTSLADTSTWPEQAKLAATGKMAELEKLQDKLKGGRRV